MASRLVQSGWGRALREAMLDDPTTLRIICPFIQLKAVEGLLAGCSPDPIQVITRFSLNDFALGVNDLSALSLLLDRGASIRGIQHLHSKLYLFGERHAAVTSANLTQAALTRNHELGFVADDPQVYSECLQYFQSLWEAAGADLEASTLREWMRQVEEYRVSQSFWEHPGLADEGAAVGVQPASTISAFSNGDRAFVKFFGESSSRCEHTTPVLEEVRGSGSHWACTYPKSKRPRQVKDGDILYMGRMVRDETDILVYGRAVGMEHDDERDNATESDIDRRPWKRDWSRYVRVHHPEFVAGTLANGVSLNELMDTLGADSFETTQRNARTGNGKNTDPRRAYLQQAAVALSAVGAEWLRERFEAKISVHGKLPHAELAKLDWPTVEPAKLQSSRTD